jgi:uncharacterized protein YutE (UPF0331/DUF86 family)
MNEPTPRQLLKELLSLKDARYKVLMYQLYIEHYVNELVCLDANEILHETLHTQLSFPQKIKILESKKIINSEQANVLKVINSVRNKMVHCLTISPRDIEKMLESTKLSFKITYEFNDIVIPIDLEKEYANGFNKFSQFETSATLLVGFLYSKFMLENGKDVEQFFKPEFIMKKNKIWEVTISVMQRANKNAKMKIS